MGVAGLVGLKNRIYSIQNTRKLTRAMALVATSKLKKTRKILSVNNDYFNAYQDVMAQLLPSISEESVYISENKAEKKLAIVIGSDAGMCGSYNNGLVSDMLEKLEGDIKSYDFLVLGERCRAVCRRHKLNILECTETIGEVPETESAKDIFEFAINEFEKGNYSQVSIIYTWFKNTIVRQPKSEVILPISKCSFSGQESAVEFEVEGEGEELIEHIARNFCEAMLYNRMLSAKASEHSVRAETMNAATKNADELCDKLKIQYNRIRQGAITQEITEIVGGVEAQG